MMTNARISLWPFCLTAAAAGMVMITLGPLLDAILKGFSAGRAEGGVLSLAFFSGMCLAIVALNCIMGGLSSKATLALGASVQGLGLLLAGGATDSFVLLALALAVTGLGYGCLLIYPGICITSLVKPSPDKSMSIINGFFAIGVLVTPPAIGHALTSGIAWRSVLLAEGAFSLFLTFVYLAARLPDIPGRKNVRIDQIKEIWRFNSRLLVLIMLTLCFYVGSETMFDVWLSKFHIDTFQSSASRAGLTVSLFWLGLTMGRFGVLRLLSSVKPRSIVFAAGLIMSGGIAMVSLVPGRTVSEAFCFVTGLGASVIFPLAASYAGRFPGWFSGVVFSFGYLASAAGAMLFPYLVGPIADLYGFRLAMLLAAVPSIAVALLAIPLDRSVKGA